MPEAAEAQLKIATFTTSKWKSLIAISPTPAGGAGISRFDHAVPTKLLPPK